MKSTEFSGFFADWETSKDQLGFESLVSRAVSGYNPSNEDIVSYVIRESGVEWSPTLMNQKVGLRNQHGIGKLYGFMGKALENNEAGNAVWGAAMSVFGSSSFLNVVFANAGALRNHHRFDELNESHATSWGAFYMDNTFSGKSLKYKLWKNVYGEQYNRIGWPPKPR